MATIQVLFFGQTAAITGKSRVDVVTSASTARGVFERVLAEHTALKSHQLLFSINQRYATGDEAVSDGDELAIFTAVSGG